VLFSARIACLLAGRARVLDNFFLCNKGHESSRMWLHVECAASGAAAARANVGGRATAVDQHYRVGLHMDMVRCDMWNPQAACIFNAKLLNTCDRALSTRCEFDRMRRRRLSKTDEADVEGERREGCRREKEHVETKPHNPYRRYLIT